MTQIRLATPDDAAALLDLQHRLDAQSPFMPLKPEEREQAPDRLRARLLSSCPPITNATSHDCRRTPHSSNPTWQDEHKCTS